LAKPNFSFQKRQKEIARQKKKEEKKQRKMEKTAVTGEGQDQPSTEAPQEGNPPTTTGPAA
jgi:hypothetical protein